ncbi:ferredoxin--NADP reductase [Undibacterium cyanobacteriorum]|uniref:ferredoxin--NADP(+) reductase n=1 Tax=Undibacterium cyanobacteriorum TaxID=3073561 RepID=A0ABY9RL21_9BURK|nr:ferredoxin--NADP reductase [Undibacterium sp. 20NA77.5]WMW81553.1 ferredoxin--NADP reductase [Undibacterium sp. 20NA77.5]
MAVFEYETVLSVRHWTDTLFSFTTTRSPHFRFENGHFVTLGLEIDGRPLMRAYSVVSSKYQETLEFLSIKVENGPLTSRLKHIKAGDQILLSRKPTGSLLISDLYEGRNLFLFATGTGLAPFMSIVRDPDTYQKFEKVILVHGVRKVAELAYRDYLEKELPHDDFLGELVQSQFLYYPTVTREEFLHRGRITDLLESGRLCEDLGIDAISAKHDRAMICGSVAMLEDMRYLLDSQGFSISPGVGQMGDYVIERSFTEK